MVNERWCFLHGGVRKDLFSTVLPTTTGQETASFTDWKKHKRRSQHHNLKTIYSVLCLLRWKDLWDTYWQFPKKQLSLWGYGKRGGSKEHISGSWDHSNGWNHLDELDRINRGEIPDKDIKLCNYGQRKRSQKKKKSI